MGSAFIRMQRHPQFLQQWFEPRIDFLHSHGPFSPFRLGEAAGVANRQSMGQVVPSPEHSAQHGGPAFLDQTEVVFVAPTSMIARSPGTRRALLLKKFRDGIEGHAVDPDRSRLQIR